MQKIASRKPQLFTSRIRNPWPRIQLSMTTTPTTSAAPASFNYRKLRPFSRAEFKFKFALGQYASERLLGKLQARARRIGTHNRYTGVNARVSEVIFLEAIVTNETEWGGFGFDFARL